MRAVIIGAAPDPALWVIKNLISPSDFIICADGGVKIAQRIGLVPALVVGDKDSCETWPGNMKQILLPRNKDDTDLFAAAKIAADRGATEVLIFGATGGRLDHTFANLCVLKFLCERKIFAKIVDEQWEIFVLQGCTLPICGRKGATLSVFPFGQETCKVTYGGLLYPMKSEILHSSHPRGISNIVSENAAKIQVESGIAAIFLEK